MEIELPSGHQCLIDDDDYNLIKPYRWSATSHGYIRGYVNRNGARIYMHRLILKAPRGMVVDHINQNGLDNRRSNIRLCTQAENCLNCSGRKSDKAYKGVYLDKRTGKFYAQIFYKRKSFSSNGHVTALSAAIAYNSLAKRLHGEFANINAIEQTP